MGAFGAHALAHIDAKLLAAFKTGVYYQLFHTLALLAVASLTQASGLLTICTRLWMLGIGLFSGSLYALALGGPTWLGPITPIGGLLLILGWVCLTFYAIKSKHD